MGPLKKKEITYTATNAHLMCPLPPPPPSQSSLFIPVFMHINVPVHSNGLKIRNANYTHTLIFTHPGRTDTSFWCRPHSIYLHSFIILLSRAMWTDWSFWIMWNSFLGADQYKWMYLEVGAVDSLTKTEKKGYGDSMLKANLYLNYSSDLFAILPLLPALSHQTDSRW